MLDIKVGTLPDADFTTIGEALLAVPYHIPATLHIAAGVYEEKVFSEKRHVRFVGEGPGKTVLRWGDAGKKLHRDGRPIHTFRSYTAFFGGECAVVAHLTIENCAGEGADVGQGIAAYVDASCARFTDVELLGSQDTLFCAPLPTREREPDGFLGPRRLCPRLPSRQLYQGCRIAGDVDFIFGGADALFESCEIVQRSAKSGTGFAAAPCGGGGTLGFVFHRSRFTGDAAAGSCYLGRPWRPEGRAAVLECELGPQIHPDGWDTWGNNEDKCAAAFSEWRNTGPGACPRPSWIRELAGEEARALLKQASLLGREVQNRAATLSKCDTSS